MCENCFWILLNNVENFWVFWIQNVQILMSVINTYNTSSLCVVKPNTGIHLTEPQAPSCSFVGRHKGVTCMTSAMPVKQVSEVRECLTGDSFIWPHLKNLSPYQPILPFEVINPYFYLFIIDFVDFYIYIFFRNAEIYLGHSNFGCMTLVSYLSYIGSKVHACIQQ